MTWKVEISINSSGQNKKKSIFDIRPISELIFAQLFTCYQDKWTFHSNALSFSNACSPALSDNTANLLMVKHEIHLAAIVNKVYVVKQCQSTPIEKRYLSNSISYLETLPELF